VEHAKFNYSPDVSFYQNYGDVCLLLDGFYAHEPKKKKLWSACLCPAVSGKPGL
jgi:hypothetical protein